MLHLYVGTDRETARAKMNVAIEKVAKKADIVRISDAHSIDDLKTVLQGGGMFAAARVLVFENVCSNPELCDTLTDALEHLAKSEIVFLFESKPLAELRKALEKYAETVEKFDAPPKGRDASIFAVASALRAGDKRALWVSYMREIEKGSAPEAIHGVLFWAAKDMVLKSGAGAARERAKRLVAELAELPHAARRRGEDVEYALERFVLSGA